MFPENIRLSITLLLLLGIAALKGDAQVFSFKATEASKKRTGEEIIAHGFPDTITVRQADWHLVTSGSGWGNTLKFKSIQGFLKFSVNHYYPKKIDSAYVYKLAYKALAYANPSDTNVFTTYSDTLLISYNPDSLTAYQNLATNKYSNYHKLVFVITGIYDVTNPATPPQLVTKRLNFKVEGSILTQKYDKSNYGSAAVLHARQVAGSASKNYLDVWWKLPSAPNTYAPLVLTPVSYELEWAYVDNYKKGPTGEVTSIPSAQLKYDFRHNATRVWTDVNRYRIPLIYPKGYIVYRVRMVRPDSVLYRYPVYGPWTLASDTGFVSAAGSDNYYEIVQPHQGDSINYQYTVSFAEQGKYKHVLSYFDGLLKNRQTITRFNSRPDRVLVTENVYDFEGRPAIKTLPAPVYDTAFHYRYNVSLNAHTKKPYKAADFDIVPAEVCPDEPMPAPLDSLALTRIYYSPLNPHQEGHQKFVPDAEGYPFVTTIYSPAFNDRVDWQGGAGPYLQPGTPHAQSNEYVGADQSDLNRLFGYNAGYAGFYRKTVSRDPNGQLSTSVADYNGRQVATAMIGAPPNGAIQLLDSLPDVKYFEDDLIGDAGMPQVISSTPSGVTKTLDATKYIDLAGIDSIEYVYTFTPFNLHCGKYLSVRAAYDYSITDKCGNLLRADSGVLGVTGVLTDPSPVSSPSGKDTFSVFFPGAISLHKDLTVNTGEIEAAVDSFIADPGNCMLTEPYFIKEAVLAEEFPCPYPDDPCAKAKYEMMQELYPDAVYGKYNWDSGELNGINSVFTLIDKGIGYRYQDTCIVSLPDTVHVGGQIYTNLAALPADTFLYVYQHVSPEERDSIAEKLLPLHPEYCKLLACFVDTFREKLLTLPNAAVAEPLQLLYLNDILDQDPLLPMLSAAGYASPADSLSKIHHGAFGIDTLAIMHAYCNSGDTVMARTCMDEVFGHEIQNIILGNEVVKENYFSKFIPMYIANRDNHKQVITGASDTCGPCAARRMVLPPPPHQPVFQTTLAPGGGLATGPGSFLGSFPDSLADYISSLMTGLDTADEETAATYLDSATITYTASMSLLCTGQIDSIITRLANCNNHNEILLGRVRDSLLALCASGQVIYGEFSPAQIRHALVSNGIVLDDLCNPWLVNYDPWPIPSGDAEIQCLEDEFYESVRQFLNKPEPLFALTHAATGATQTMNLSPTSTFEQLIKDQINPSSGSVTLHASYTGGNTNLYKLFLYDASVSGDTAKIYLRGNPAQCANFFASGGAVDSFFFSEIACFSSAGGYVPPSRGYITHFAFLANAYKVSESGAEICRLTGWTDSVIANTYRNSQIAGCVPCGQAKQLYTAFADTLAAYDIKGADHPYYATMLKSFMNHKLRRSFTHGQYLDFIESCALADSMVIGNYVAYSTFIFNNDVSANTFLSQLNNVLPDEVAFINPYREKVGTQCKVLIDLKQVPHHKLYLFKQFLQGYNSGVVTKLVNQPLRNLQAPNTAGFLFAPAGGGFSIDLAAIFPGTPPFTISAPAVVGIRMGTTYQNHTYYTLAAVPGITPAALSDGIGRLIKYCADSAVFMPNYLATTNSEYWLEEKKAYLRRAYGFPDLPAERMLDSLQADVLAAQVPLYSGRNLMYGLPLNPGLISNLYLSDPSSANSRFDTISHMLHTVSDILPGSAIIPQFIGDNRTWHGTSYGPDDFNVYLCSDGSYWYRYFGTNDTLYNFFLRLPVYIPRSDHHLYKLVAMAPALGDSTTRQVDVWLRKGTEPIIRVTGQADFVVGRNITLQHVLLTYDVTQAVPGPDTAYNCERGKLVNAIHVGIINYHNYVDSMRTALVAAFKYHVMNNLGEKLILGYQDRKFLFTLYHYDRAGNLMATVPPEGVRRLDNGLLADVNAARANNTTEPELLPDHKKVSTYKYNSLNKLIYQKTPDGGEVYYFLDALGRNVFAQNDKQKFQGAYTYTLYDEQGRITETGEATLGCPWFPEYVTDLKPKAPCFFSYSLDDTYKLFSPHPGFIRYSETKPLDSFRHYLYAVPRRDVVLTTYDTATINLDTINGMSAQENLRKRVAALRYYEKLPPGDTALDRYTYASYYSYDIGGNVKTLTHDFPALKTVGHRYKRIDYDYDLISGKVNMLSYNRSFRDQYYQRYAYDDDNRITLVESSPDGYLWQRDAGYEYYEHGPLARTSFGNLRVQGLDYAYTLQGWLKGINGELSDTARDMGGDGRLASIHSRDAYGATLSYFTNDYKPIGGISFTAQADIPTTASLYNGNIPRQHTSLLPLLAQNANYTYDQLNRLAVSAYQQYQPLGDTLLPTTDYASRYRYDQDGNLRFLMRRGPGELMDSLLYRYSAAQTDNQLQNVAELAPDPTSTTNDIRQFTELAVTRYLYDPIGNLVKDLVTGQDTIAWNLYGKMTYTKNNTAQKELSFTYDGAGNRVAKYYTKYDGRGDRKHNEYYVRDAQGNILAVYNESYKYEPLTWIKTISEDIIAHTGTSVFVDDFIGPAYAPEPAFSMMVMDAAVQNPSLTTSILGSYPFSFFYQINPAIPEGLLYSGVTYMQALKAYQITSGDTLLGKALSSAYADIQGPGTADNITAALFDSKATATQKAAVLGLSCAGSGDLLLRHLASANQVTLPSGTCQLKADTLARRLPALRTLQSQLRQMYQRYPAQTALWLKQVASNNVVWADSFYAGSAQGQGNFLYALRDAVARYGDEQSLLPFWDSYPQTPELLTQTQPAEQLLTQCYEANPGPFLQASVSALGIDSAIYKPLSKIASLTPQSYTAMAMKFIPTYTPVTFAQYLAEHRFWLAEHHLYGSSRLGLRQYWPTELYSLWDYTDGKTEVDTSRFAMRRPWYSYAYQAGIKKDSTRAPYGAADSTQPLFFQQQTGMKQYELTNHLGNVMAVVSDKRVNLDDNGDTLIDRYAPSLAAVYDYFPFGMLMPGRYLQDDATHCMTITQTQIVPVRVPVIDHVTGPFSPVKGGSGIFVPLDEDVVITASSVGSGVEISHSVTAGAALALELEVKTVEYGSFSVVISEEVAGKQVVLGGIGIQARGAYSASVVPQSSTVKVSITASSAQAQGARLIIKPYVWTRTVPTPKAVPVVVCNDREDYRFGFNGQEKVNEIAGIGNHLDFKFRGYDSRIGRFWSVDPLANKYPSHTDYGFAQNSPISGIDLEGLEYLNHNEARVEFKHGNLLAKVENFHTINKNAWKRTEMNPLNWKNGSIGLSRALGNISIIAPLPPSPSASDIPDVGAAKPVERYMSDIASNKHDQRPGIVGPAGKNVGFSRSIIVIDAINLGLDALRTWAGKDDADLVTKHSKIAERVSENVTDALRQGMIPPKYHNKEGLTNIMNVVLQGENNTKDPEIYKIGIDIYNRNTGGVRTPSGMDNFPGRVIPSPGVPNK